MQPSPSRTISSGLLRLRLWVPRPASHALSPVPIARVAELLWLTRPCPRPQDEADAHHRQLLVLQPGHGRAVREPQLLGLSPLRAVQRLPGGMGSPPPGRRTRAQGAGVAVSHHYKWRIGVHTQIFLAPKPVPCLVSDQQSAGSLQRPGSGPVGHALLRPPGFVIPPPQTTRTQARVGSGAEKLAQTQAASPRVALELPGVAGCQGVRGGGQAARSGLHGKFLQKRSFCRSCKERRGLRSATFSLECR